MINRRSLLKNTMLMGAGALASQLPLSRAFAQEKSLRLYWWGSQDRTKRTLDVGQLYEHTHPGTKIVGEANGADYWPKLTTMIAGKNMPDIVQFEPSTLPDYSKRNILLPLDGYIGKTIKTDKFAPGALELGTVDGKVTGIPLSINAFALFYNADAFAAAGMKPPAAAATWDEYADLAVELTKKHGKSKVWASPNASRYNYVFQAWLTQRGKLLFTADGKLGFDVNDAKEWYDYWDKLNKRGGVVAADVQAQDQSLIDSNPLAKGNALMAFAFSNQLSGYQNINQAKLGITSLPHLGSGKPSGLFYRPGLHWAIGKDAKNPDEAAAFIDFFVNDLNAGKLLGAERGVPVNLDVRDAIGSQIDPITQKTVDYIGEIAKRVTSYPPPSPAGSNEIDHQVFRPTADKLAFGQISVAEAAETLVNDSKRILKY